MVAQSLQSKKRKIQDGQHQPAKRARLQLRDITNLNEERMGQNKRQIKAPHRFE
jgi:hypothetical protein